jgi:hypothetical protein
MGSPPMIAVNSAQLAPHPLGGRISALSALSGVSAYTLWSGHSGSSMPDWEKWRPIRPTRLHQPRSRDSPSWGWVSFLCFHRALFRCPPLPLVRSPPLLFFPFISHSTSSSSSSSSTYTHQSKPSQWAGSLVCAPMAGLLLSHAIPLSIHLYSTPHDTLLLPRLLRTPH